MHWEFAGDEKIDAVRFPRIVDEAGFCDVDAGTWLDLRDTETLTTTALIGLDRAAMRGPVGVVVTPGSAIARTLHERYYLTPAPDHWCAWRLELRAL